MSNVKESWSQGHYVEQHSRAELQVCTRSARRFGITSTHLATLSRISTLSLGSHLHSSRPSRGSVATAPPACRRCAHPCGTSCERVPAPGSKSLSDGLYNGHHQILERQFKLLSYCSHLLEHVLPRAGSDALPRSRIRHRTNRCTALSTVSHSPSRYPMVRDLVVRIFTLRGRRTWKGWEKLGRDWRQVFGSQLLPSKKKKKWRNAYLHFRDLWKF